MKQLHAMIAFATSLIAVLIFVLLGTYNYALPNYVKLTVPQFIQNLAVSSTGIIDQLPQNTYVLLTESANIFDTGSDVLADKITYNFNAIYDNLIVVNGDDNNILISSITDAVNQTKIALNEIREESLGQAESLGQQTFIELPDQMQNLVLKPVDIYANKLMDQSLAYTSDNLTKPLISDMTNTIITYATQ